MGRRKIEIKPIRDDRNRSVTFLKRKGGLFKKAHELSVLCSVDVAVIIFGHNKKLYEYSSSDINDIIGRFQYYGGAHEHKGPSDFADKGGGDDDDEDGEGGEEMDDRNTPIPDHPVMHSHVQNHPSLQHLRHSTPTASPPMANGPMPQFNRGPSPVPPGMSRPSSRTSQHHGHIRRTSSNFAAAHGHQGQGTPPQPTYAYSPNPPFHHAQGQPLMQPRQAAYPHAASYPPPAPYAPVSQAPLQHVQQAYLQDGRGGSMPPAFPTSAPVQHNMSRHSSQEHLQPPLPPNTAQTSPRLVHQRPTASPQPQQQEFASPPLPQPQQQEFASPPLPQPKALPAHAKSHSIFTPIDDSRSMLAQHWGTVAATSSSDSLKPEALTKPEDGGPRSQSIDIATISRDKAAAARVQTASSALPPPPTRNSPKHEGRSLSSSSVPKVSSTTRSNTAQSDAKRPRLKVQIPSEHSGDEAGTGSGDEPSSSTRPPQQPQHGVVLPPPSPSASALLSAGAQGPPNPFARPAPPMSTNPHVMPRDSNHIETPMSALPSRFMSDNLLPSPSTFYPEWGFGRSGDANMLPSPLNFQTPVVSNGTGWKEEDRKRPSEEDAAGNDPKRTKS